MKYKFDYYLVISKTYKYPESEDKSHSSKDERTWVNAEEEFLIKVLIIIIIINTNTNSNNNNKNNNNNNNSDNSNNIGDNI